MGRGKRPLLLRSSLTNPTRRTCKSNREIKITWFLLFSNVSIYTSTKPILPTRLYDVCVPLYTCNNIYLLPCKLQVSHHIMNKNCFLYFFCLCKKNDFFLISELFILLIFFQDILIRRVKT